MESVPYASESVEIRQLEALSKKPRRYRHGIHRLAYVNLDRSNGGILRNLNETGIALQAVAPLRENQQVHVRFELTSPRIRVETLGRIRWADNFGQAGVQFLDLPERTRRLLKEWIFTQVLAEAYRGSKESIFIQPESEINLLFSPTTRPTIALDSEVLCASDSEFSEDAMVRFRWCPVAISAGSLSWLIDSLILVSAVFVFVALSLIHALLGWHKAVAGCVRIDGEPLDAARLDRLRGETAWVDPAVQLWNRSFLGNLLYGTPTDPALSVGWVIDQADLRSVLEKLPEGLQTPLGEGGGLVSGGEGQRVRLGRAMLRSGVRLVILDEPFRGLDHEQRRELLSRARRMWRHATLLCITHDVSETRAFARVLVVEGGQIVEDGPPADLAQRPGSRYQTMLAMEAAVREDLWSSAAWLPVLELEPVVAT